MIYSYLLSFIITFVDQNSHFNIERKYHFVEEILKKVVSTRISGPRSR